MHIKVDDKFAAKEKLGGFCNIGDIAKVTNVTDDGQIAFTFDNCEENNAVFTRSGCMDTATFERCFEKIEDEVKKDEKIRTITIDEIDEDYIYEILDRSKFDVYTVFDKCTVVSCLLPNGTIITETCCFENSEEYDEKQGFDVCYNEIFGKVWEFESYKYRDNTYYESFKDNEELDCENCEDYDCPDNPHYCS